MSLKRAALAMIPALLVVLTGCDDKIIYRDKPQYEEPLPAALSFLGYYNQADGQTTCGNCHVGVQKEWSGTDHADAWNGLQDSGHAQEFCEGCHTVNELGNVVTEPAGHTATGEERYYDVQCESCHGPGKEHVDLPNDATVPLAAMDVGLDLTQGCGECHQGAHHPFAEDWSQSAHASANPYPAGRSSCDYCHTGEGALREWGVKTVYLEQDDVAQEGNHLAITCAVCHDPHGSENTAQLRFSIEEFSEDGNLCMKCHHKRGIPDPTTFRGPHSPEGPTILGVAGWFPPGMQYPILSTHGSQTLNPRLCAGCHVNSFDVTDEVTGEFLFSATGHLFEATPCVDAQGIPVAGPCDAADKVYPACTRCHDEVTGGGPGGLIESAYTSIESPIAELAALIALVPDTEFDPSDDRYTVGEGAKFNLDLAETPGAVVHNALLIRALLDASIQAVKDEYGL